MTGATPSHFRGPGKYPRDRVAGHLGYYNDGHNNIAVRCDVVDPLAVAPEKGRIDNDAGPVVPNSRANWKALLAGVIEKPAFRPQANTESAPYSNRVSNSGAAMNVSRFHNLIGKLLVENRAGRLTVCIDKSTFHDNRESDGCVILEVCGAEIVTHPMPDDDGGMAENKDGTERQRTTLVLYGNSHSPTREDHGG